MDPGAFIYELFQDLGLPGMLLTLYFIFVINAMIFPALPELFALTFFIAGAETMVGGDIFLWGVTILIVGLCGSVTGNTLLYLIVKRAKVPAFLEKVMNKYANTLFVKDERIILVNRIAPVLPFVGAFIAVCGWNFKKSIFYVALGGAIKYAVLLSMAGMFLRLFESGTARDATLVLILIVIGFSLVASQVQKKRMEKKEGLG